MPETDLTAQLRALPDVEFLAVVKAASADRPGLGAVHAAAATERAAATAEPPSDPESPSDPEPTSNPEPTTPEIPSDPAVPSTPDIPTTTDVPPPAQISQATPTAGHTVTPDYTAGGVPTFDRVREKVEQRYGTSLGAEELDKETPAGRSLQEQWDAREKAGHEKLDQIRQSMHAGGEQSTTEEPKENE